MAEVLTGTQDHDVCRRLEFGAVFAMDHIAQVMLCQARDQEQQSNVLSNPTSLLDLDTETNLIFMTTFAKAQKCFAKQ